ncbi:hypothetical protein [Paraflavitalea speifideaquila]|uniref:hypothetical protein n=1 Tax=Paraflavitalea speifideaquila TaxID=3076558 RepID=UPI0028E344C5|nr:hypothetical protein [Paraflavitalea speifideiaquila]
MKLTIGQRLGTLLFILFFASPAQPQTIKRLDASTLTATALTSRIQQLVDTAHVTGMGISTITDGQYQL